MSRAKTPDVSIRVDDLSLIRGDARVIDGLSFTLAHGETLTIMGPTGAGKSSLAAVLAGRAGGSISVAGGEAVVEGISVKRPGRALRTLTYVTGYLPQGGGSDLPARLTVSEVIAEPITSRDRRVNPRALAVRVATLLDEMQLPLGAAPKYPYELSAGMRQRVAMARALVLDPRLVVADDLYANLDIEVRETVLEAVRRRRASYGLSALVVTNDPDAARELDSDVLVLRAGHTVAYGADAGTMVWTPDEANDHRSVVR
ncbi:ABC transporter ATP-binding protein [Microbacterium sp. Gd 4-13]|uniref:ATP-binding cassette domain-containing protein n=1 Tax=Microbacterium sp. Gd 4-13 TaxID=2173179 RepID=UPI000D56497F|nr:ATP-binding cassette domain-containing protein [Microbacterium sp. Gd 4-13]PVW06548.1 ABC transporter ATP-binding protein [Microbacterium sp. Gd 4-13]